MVYFALSKMFPADETMLDRAIVDPETLPNDRRESSGVEETGGRVDETKVALKFEN